MYYTTFYAGERSEYSIIHANPAAPYGDGLATYAPFVQVNKKPTLKQAKTIFGIIKWERLCAGMSSAKTVKLRTPFLYRLARYAGFQP